MVNITYRAMTLQTCSYHTKPELVYGIPEFQFKKFCVSTFGIKKQGTEQQVVVHLRTFHRGVNEKENYQYKAGEVFFSQTTMLINRDTLEVSVNGSEFEKVSFEKCYQLPYEANL